MKTSNGQAYVCFIVIQNKKFKLLLRIQKIFIIKFLNPRDLRPTSTM